jgi:hypothetical protein
MREGKEQGGKAKLAATEDKQSTVEPMVWTRGRIAYDLIDHK